MEEERHPSVPSVRAALAFTPTEGAGGMIDPYLHLAVGPLEEPYPDCDCDGLCVCEGDPAWCDCIHCELDDEEET
jgi:hypothetical protein